VINHSTSRQRKSKEFLPPTFVSEPETQSNSFVGTEEYIAPVRYMAYFHLWEWFMSGTLICRCLLGPNCKKKAVIFVGVTLLMKLQYNNILCQVPLDNLPIFVLDRDKKI
jgi:hypothetical protein